MIRDSLCLDHFYIGFTAEEIEDLKKLTKALERCSFRRVRSGKDSWEGVYLYSNLGSYFEMILGPKDYGLGVACSSHAIQYVDSRKIKHELRSLPWRLKSRPWKETSKVWFDWLALKPLNSRGWSYQPFYSWIMHYHPLHVEERIKRPQQGSIDRFQSLSLVMGKEHAEYVKHHSRWLPGSIRLKRNSATFVLPNRDSGSFQIDIEYSKAKSTPRLKSLQMTLCPDVAFKPIALKLFNLKKSGETLILSSKSSI